MSNNNEKLVKDIRRRTRKKYSSEEKIRIVLEGMRGEESIAELCRREGLNQNVYYRWSKEFLEAGKQRLAGDIKRESEPPRVCRRLHFLRGWSNEQTQTLSPGSPGTGRAAGAGAPGELSLPMGCTNFHRR